MAEIGHRLAGPAAGSERVALERSACWACQVAPEVTVYVRADAAPWRARLIQRALQELAQRLALNLNETESDHATSP